jgi:nickel superoxide dismutase
MNYKKAAFGVASIALLTILLSVSGASAHCEIPCGIYDDHMRIHLIEEDATTIEKAMKQIVKLGGETPINHNQMVRWITNKEAHANRIQETVYQYFMTQRIKAGDDNYQEKLVLLHQMLVAAMKCKQTTDLSNVENLRKALSTFEKLYLGESGGD